MNKKSRELQPNPNENRLQYVVESINRPMFYFFRFRFLSGCCKSSFVQHISIKMDLMCNEKETFKDHQLSAVNEIPMHIEAQVNTASADPTFLSERCLENLLKSEDTHPVVNFYNNPLCEITPKMRRIVAEWMMEVSFHVYHLLNDSIKFILLYFLWNRWFCWFI